MKLEAIKNVGGRLLGRSVLVAQKHSPAALTAVGVVGVVATAVAAAKATTKLEPIIDLMNERLEVSSKVSPEGSDQARKEKMAIYIIAARDICKLYAPAVGFAAVSIAAILGAHGIMKRRNVALAAAYKGLEKSFTEYRNRVAAELGEDKEESLRHQFVEREETVGDEVVKVQESGYLGISPYARFFDECSVNWSKVSEYNLMFVRTQQQYANDLLRSRGHVFLNEVYDMLGIPRSKEGAIVGWVTGNGDNYIDFGMYDDASEKARQFVNGYERSILLDFNVDGVIYDLI